jgi:hypothetical protein
MLLTLDQSGLEHIPQIDYWLIHSISTYSQEILRSQAAISLPFDNVPWRIILYKYFAIPKA